MSPLPGGGSGLFTDLYELTMAQAYSSGGMRGEATFSLYFRHLPEGRNYMLACGVEAAVDFALGARFSSGDIAWLRSQDRFGDDFLRWLEGYRFTGSIHAMPEGTPVFPGEPIVEVTGPIALAQLLETGVMNQVHAPTVLASKASRVVRAARGRPVLDFGMRRVHGADNSVEAARAFHVAGVAATSNVLAGRRHGVPLAGTMAHSFVQAHASEREAFEHFCREFPDTVLLVDSYDTANGVEEVIALARELGDDFAVRGIRLDSGELGPLARHCRERLDEAGLGQVEIFASGGLDEDRIDRLLEGGAPIDGFGVGTAMGVSADAPALDIAYKLAEYDGQGRMKLSPGKGNLPGKKQVYRQAGGDGGARDLLARRDEAHAGTPLLEEFVRAGERVREREAAGVGRERAAAALEQLPGQLLGLRPADPPYPVEESRALQEHAREIREQVERVAGLSRRDR